MQKYLLIFHILLITILNLNSQISLTGYCLDFDSKMPIKSKISIKNKEGVSYLSKTNDKGYFKFDSINAGSYTITILPFNDTTIFETVAITNPNGEPINWLTTRHYCPLVKENYSINNTTHQTFYMLYTAGGELQGDGFPQRRKIFKIIPIPFWIVSFCTSSVSGGSVERYSRTISEKKTKETNLYRFKIQTHATYDSFHDIYIKPEASDTIHYNCIGGTLFWVE